MTLRPDAVAELIRISKSEVISILRKQKGFLHETTLIAPERGEVVASSFWNSREDAEAYDRTAYLEVLTVLASVIDGTPSVKSFELATLTFQSYVAGRLA